MSIGTGINGVAIAAGYKGIAILDGDKFRFADANITARQEIEAPDLIMGDWDRDAYVYGKIEVGGTISGPITQTFAAGTDSILKWGAGRKPDCGTLTQKDLTLHYFCGRKRDFEGLYVNSMTISVAAGDVAQFSLDVIGVSADDTIADAGETESQFRLAEKLLTWDKISLSLTTRDGETLTSDDVAFSNFEFTVNNNVETVYSIGQDDLFPFDIVPGLRTISGSLSIYNVPNFFNGADTFDSYCAAETGELTFTLGDAGCGFEGPDPVTMKVQFHRIEPTSSTGPIVSTVGFTGVTHQEGSIWDADA